MRFLTSTILLSVTLPYNPLTASVQCINDHRTLAWASLSQTEFPRSPGYKRVMLSHVSKYLSRHRTVEKCLLDTTRWRVSLRRQARPHKVRTELYLLALLRTHRILDSSEFSLNSTGGFPKTPGMVEERLPGWILGWGTCVIPLPSRKSIICCFMLG